MTFYAFIALSKKEQAETTWHGEFFMTREDRKHTVALYKVHDLYIEVSYNDATNKIERFNPFVSKKRLELYFNRQQN